MKIVARRLGQGGTYRNFLLRIFVIVLFKSLPAGLLKFSDAILNILFYFS
jgi:hypothetical protein